MHPRGDGVAQPPGEHGDRVGLEVREVEAAAGVLGPQRGQVHGRVDGQVDVGVHRRVDARVDVEVHGRVDVGVHASRP